MFLIDRPHVRGVSLSAKTKLNLRFRWLSEHEGSTCKTSAPGITVKRFRRKAMELAGFRALSLGLNGSEDRHAEVRANIVQHLRENPETYAGFVEGAEVFANYVNRISRDRGVG